MYCFCDAPSPLESTYLSGSKMAGTEDFRGDVCPAEAQCRCKSSYSCIVMDLSRRKASRKSREDTAHNVSAICDNNFCHCPVSHDSHRHHRPSHNNKLLLPSSVERIIIPRSISSTSRLMPTKNDGIHLGDDPISSSSQTPLSTTTYCLNCSIASLPDLPCDCLKRVHQQHRRTNDCSSYSCRRKNSASIQMNNCDSTKYDSIATHVSAADCIFNPSKEKSQDPWTPPGLRKCLSYLFRASSNCSSGRRRRPWKLSTATMSRFLYLVLLLTGYFYSADACSSRSTPKPRPPSPTLRPNITIQTYTCPPEYDTHYCLNGATCFTVKIGESILYNCECSEGYMGQRCEFKDLDGTYLPSKNRAMLEQAGITSSVAIIVIMIICICCYLYVHRRSKKESASRRLGGHDEVDSASRPPRPFSGQYSSKLHHHSVAVPASHRTYPCPDAFPPTRYHSPPTQRVLQQTSFANVSSSPTNDNSPPNNHFQSYHLQPSSNLPSSSSPYCTSISVDPPHLVVSEVIPEAGCRTVSSMGHQSPTPPKSSSPNPCSDPPRLVVTSTYSTPSSDKPRLCV